MAIAHKFGDDINTDLIIAGKYKYSITDLSILATHVMEDLDPQFYSKLSSGDVIVAGSNFGCGSSREQAPLALREAGVAAVLAQSFSRIFFRNAINVGLIALECDTSQIDDGDELVVDASRGVITNLTQKTEITALPLPSVMVKILTAGGLVNYLRQHGTFPES